MAGFGTLFAHCCKRNLKSHRGSEILFVPKSISKLNGKIESIFYDNGLLMVSGVVYMNFLTNFHHLLISLSVSQDSRKPQMTFTKSQNWHISRKSPKINKCCFLLKFQRQFFGWTPEVRACWFIWSALSCWWCYRILKLWWA